MKNYAMIIFIIFLSVILEMYAIFLKIKLSDLKNAYSLKGNLSIHIDYKILI